MKRLLLAAVIGLGTFGIAGAAQAHDWCGPPVHHPYRAAYFYGPPVVYAAPAPVYAAYPPAPVVYPSNSISLFGRNFALRFGF